MTSLQIAEITGKRHDHIIRDIKNLKTKLLEYNPNLGATNKISDYVIEESVYIASNGKRNMMYALNKKACLLLASGYDILLRAAIIDRWEELEKVAYYQIPQTLSEALSLASKQAKTIEEQQLLLDYQAPKVQFAKAVEDSEDYCLIDVLAKVLKQNGVEIGQNRLFKWLHKNKYLCVKGGDKNHPTQKSMNLKVFRIVVHIIELPSGKNKNVRTTKLTPKGVSYFVNKFLSMDKIE